MVDLVTQAEAVARHVRDWTKPSILRWLRQYGEIKQSALNPDLYVFYAPSGLVSAFLLDEEGNFILAR